MLVGNNRAGSIGPLSDSAPDLTGIGHASTSQTTMTVLVQSAARHGNCQTVFRINFEVRRTGGHFIFNF